MGDRCGVCETFADVEVGGRDSLKGATVTGLETRVLTICGAGAASWSWSQCPWEVPALGKCRAVPSMVIHAGVQAGVNSSFIGLKIVVAGVGFRWWHCGGSPGNEPSIHETGWLWRAS